MHRRRAVVAVALVVPLALSACREHTVAIRFEPEVGDRYRLRSDIETEVARTIDDETAVDRAETTLEAVESIVDVDGGEVAVEVTVERDGSAPRTYEVRFDRTGRLSTIDLVEGVPTAALGLDLATELPPDVASPPGRRLEPGATWEIDRELAVDGRDGPVRVTGRGWIDSLGVEDGVEVAVAVVELVVPVRSVVETADGRVRLLGEQTSRTRTAYALADGTARRERTEIHGEIDVLVEPPADVDAPPVPGSVVYDVRTESRREPAA